MSTTYSEPQRKAMRAMQQHAVSARDIGARENTMRALLRRGMVMVHHTVPQPVGDRRWYYVLTDAGRAEVARLVAESMRVTVEETVLDDPEDIATALAALNGRNSGEVPAALFGSEHDGTYWAQVWDFDGQDWTERPDAVEVREHAPYMMGQGPRAQYTAQTFPDRAAAEAWISRARRDGYTYTVHTFGGAL